MKRIHRKPIEIEKFMVVLDDMPALKMWSETHFKPHLESEPGVSGSFDFRGKNLHTLLESC